MDTEIRSFQDYAAEVLVKQDKLSPAKMALLVTCMDYRYPHRVVNVMDGLGLARAYDTFVLAGASLGAHVPKWQEVLVSHVKAAVFLNHHIKKIVLLDHRDCGAYKHPREIGVPENVLKDGLPDDVLPSKEKACHLAVAEMLVPVLKKKLKKESPDLVIDALLMPRDEDDVLFRDR